MQNDGELKRQNDLVPTFYDPTQFQTNTQVITTPFSPLSTATAAQQQSNKVGLNIY